MKPIVIAIDGPAASGKGTLARSLASKLGYAYLDTGALYRLVAKTMLDIGHDPHDESLAASAAKQLALALRPESLQDAGLRLDTVGQAASIVAKFPSVREALLDLQRSFAAAPKNNDGGDAPGVVMDGRDIGTVICPDADVKLFVTASIEERARRRLHELEAKGVSTDFAAVLEEMAIRDKRDSERDTAPLKPAPDAHLLDTSELSADQVMDRAFALIKGR